MRPLMFETDTQFWYETLRVLGHASYEGADVAEALSTAERIAPGDYDSWHEEWWATAERVEAEARGQLAAGHAVSAHDGLLRAATYFRSAEFFLRDEPADPRGSQTYERGVACFTDAVALTDPPVQPIRVPYEGTTLNGYLYRAGNNGEPRPTLLIHSGFDGWAEEMHHTGALAAQQRGYTAIAFDGPGQPGPRWHDGLVFRPDWEAAVSPVIDFALGLPEVDGERIALCGNSMGGELAPQRSTNASAR